MELVKLKDYNRIYHVDSFEKGYRTMFKKSYTEFKSCSDMLFQNLKRLDNEGLKVLTLQQFEDLHTSVQGYPLYSIHHVSEKNPRVLFFAYKNNAFILLHSFLEKSASDYQNGIKRASTILKNLIKQEDSR